MNDEYERRKSLCSKAVNKVTKKLGLTWGFAEDYQGIEIKVDTEVGEGKVIILFETGHGPRFPKYITFAVHGYIDHQVNKRVSICGGGIGWTKTKFLPDKINLLWLQDAINNSAKSIKYICTSERMAYLQKEALELRRRELKEKLVTKHQETILNPLH